MIGRCDIWQIQNVGGQKRELVKEDLSGNCLCHHWLLVHSVMSLSCLIECVKYAATIKEKKSQKRLKQNKTQKQQIILLLFARRNFFLKKDNGIVSNVLPGSIAEESGIEIGDMILSVNGETIQDVFDYRFLVSNEYLVVEVLKKCGDIWEIEIEKDQYEDLGIEFNTSLMDDLRSCRNKCIFCFIDQLPAGMRDTLYFKDDDSRMSFLMGNYVTLTNMNEHEIDKIIKYKMSPINISVHTTNPELRMFMLRNKFAGNIIDKIRKLTEGGISVNCQIVLCRGINDGRELDRTIQDLARFSPGINSISVVPVGITKYRQNLFELKPFDEHSSREVIEQISKLQKIFIKNYDSRIVYLADEFYIMAKADIPAYEEYEDFPQIENGVGLISLLEYEINEYLGKILWQYEGRIMSRNISIATGVSAYDYIKKWSEMLIKKTNGLKINVYKIENTFFGENVTVAGLITGQDLLEQLRGKDLGDELLISSSMLKADEDIFLDDYTLDMLERQLNTKITSVDNNGEDFVNSILGLEVRMDE
jgi:putative radical SAM enzyme (TIGR03279 family)